MSRVSVKGTQSKITKAHFEVSVKAGGVMLGASG